MEVVLLHVVLQERESREADPKRLGVSGRSCSIAAFRTPVVVVTVLSLRVRPQAGTGVIGNTTNGSGHRVLVRADESFLVVVLGEDMTLKRLMLAEDLAARREVSTLEFFALVGLKLVSAKTGTCEKALSTVGLITQILSHVTVGSFDVLRQMVAQYVSLVTAGIGTLERTLIFV